MEWFRYTSMIHYAYQNMQILEFSKGPSIMWVLILYLFYFKINKFFSNFRCAEQSKFEICSQLDDNGTRNQVIPVESILEAQGCTAPLWFNTVVLVGFLVVFRLLGYFVLRYVRCPKWWRMKEGARDALLNEHKVRSDRGTRSLQRDWIIVWWGTLC